MSTAPDFRGATYTGTSTMPSYTALDLRKASARAQSLTWLNHRSRFNEAAMVIDANVRAFRVLFELTGPTDFLHDTARGFRDEMVNIQHDLDKALDEAGIDASVPERLDLSEIDALITRLP